MKKQDMTKRGLCDTVWKIRVHCASHLDSWMKDYFNGLTVRYLKDGRSVLTGSLPDMAAVYGLLLKLRDSGILLVSLKIVSICNAITRY